MRDDGEGAFNEAFAEFYSKNPAEAKAIGGSFFATIYMWMVLEWMWVTGTECGVWGDDYSCHGLVWLTLAHNSILSCAAAPGIWGIFSALAKKFAHVDEQKRTELVSFATWGIPFAIIWATLWLYCLPTTWGLLPLGAENWWGIFPFIFGLSWFGGGPLFVTIGGIGAKFKEFSETEKQAHEFEDDFKTKLASSADETMNFEFREKKILDSTDQPLAKENDEDAKIIQTEFTSILGDMNIHEKYKK